MTMEGTKRCPQCRLTLPLSSFHANKSRAKGVASECEECARRTSRERWNRKRTETYEEMCDRWLKQGQNVKRAHSLSGKLLPCPKCGEPMQEPARECGWCADPLDDGLVPAA